MALILDIKVIPQSGKQACALDKNGTIKIHLKSAPEGGKANEELCKLISKKLKLAQDTVSILLGKTSRTKRIHIEGAFTQKDVELALGIERQKTLIP
jgi:uncharacterized protein (TIGR00251 family)